MLNHNSLLDDVTPLTFQLAQNYPNPFRERTSIKYCIAYKTKVKLKVYDEEHKEIATLVDEYKPAGRYEVEFDAEKLASGVYFYKLQAVPIGRQAGDYVSVKKMILIK